ncbi:unnamed protein product [Paramecium sonneborni]|uniref:Transmembrane protein n=1 Tax=Paramecium sonneborni TaxID=65129 RepID=A0A8S1RSK4_9CILI|nr:unnamed protein product [Paramecium sonneborni]
MIDIKVNYQHQLLISNQCLQLINCGDVLFQEECDHENQQSVDGCLHCLIEQHRIFTPIIKDSSNQCSFVKAPNFIINYLNMTYNKQYIHIQSDQIVKIQTKQQIFRYQIQIISIGIQLIYKQDVGSDLSFGEFIVQLEVYYLLQYPNLFNETQKEYSDILKSYNQNIIYCLSAITGINLLLAILQFQQYLRYIDLDFPLDLEIYFSLYDIITNQPLMDFIQFPQLLQFIDIQSNQEYSDDKSNMYKQSSSLIINHSCQIFQFVILLSRFLWSQWIKKVVYNWIFNSWYFSSMSKVSLYMSPKLIFMFSLPNISFECNYLNWKKLFLSEGFKKPQSQIVEIRYLKHYCIHEAFKQQISQILYKLLSLASQQFFILPQCQIVSKV